MTAGREELRGLVRDLLAQKGDREPLREGDALLTSGRLDSVDVLEIVSFLERRHGLDFGKRSFDPGEFDTLEGIERLLAGPGRNS